MKLREALKATNWEYFKNNQNEIWETNQVLNDPDADQWLDEEVCITIARDKIQTLTVDGYLRGEYYTEKKESKTELSKEEYPYDAWRDELSQKIDAILKQ